MTYDVRSGYKITRGMQGIVGRTSKRYRDSEISINVNDWQYFTHSVTNVTDIEARRQENLQGRRERDRQRRAEEIVEQREEVS